MRARFELIEWADSLQQAQEFVVESASDFLQVSREDIPSLVDFEYKIEYPNEEDKNRDHIASFKVTAYGSVKNSVLHPGR
jgi:hypothetical protein